MTTATRLAKQIAKTYQSVLLVRTKAQDKLDALLASQPFYALFEHGNTHPYYAQVRSAERFFEDYKELIGLLLGVKVGSETISDALDKMNESLLANGKSPDVGIEAVRMLTSEKIRNVKALKVGEKSLLVFSNAMLIYSFCDLKATKAKLEELHSKKLAKKQLEVPYLNINAQCSAAVKDVKKLVKLLLDLTVTGESVRLELDKKQTMNALAGKINGYATAMIAL